MGLSFMLTSCIIIWNVAFFISVQSYTICPKDICSCKWKFGKQTAECVGQGLTIIPDGLNPGTQVIDLGHNRFKMLSSRVFQMKGLVNLQKIFLAECGILEIASDAFFQLSNLVELDLSRNELTQIPTQALRDCPHLRRLELAQNPIKHIDDGAFSFLPHLTFLNLSNCGIETLQPGVFDGLKSLKFLKLDGNTISTLSLSVVESLTQLSGLQLHNNPWNCDCRIRDIRKWMLDQNIPLEVPPQCVSPKQIKGTTWDFMSLEDFACPPSIIKPRKTEVNVVLSQNASILCQVDSVPKANVYWEIGGRYLANITSFPEYRGKFVLDIEAFEVSSTQFSRLTVINAVESDSDIYTCTAENKAGKTSLNFTISVVLPYLTDGSWSTTQISVVTVSVLLVVIIAIVIICILVFQPESLTTSAKMSGVGIFRHFKTKKQDFTEINDIAGDKIEKDIKASDKQPRQETGSSGYGSDQLTPDLVSKIVDTNHGPSLSTSTLSCNHPDIDNSATTESYGPMAEHWSANKSKPPRYDDSPGRSLYSEIYPNPCYNREEADPYNTMQSPTMLHHPEFHAERYIPQNDRVKTLRAGFECSGSLVGAEGSRDDLCINPSSNNMWKRSLSMANNVSHYTLPTKARFSPDEGYAEEALEGTEV